MAAEQWYYITNVFRLHEKFKYLIIRKYCIKKLINFKKSNVNKRFAYLPIKYRITIEAGRYTASRIACFGYKSFFLCYDTIHIITGSLLRRSERVSYNNFIVKNTTVLLPTRSAAVCASNGKDYAHHASTGPDVAQ